MFKKIPIYIFIALSFNVNAQNFNQQDKPKTSCSVPTQKSNSFSVSDFTKPIVKKDALESSKSKDKSKLNKKDEHLKKN